MPKAKGDMKKMPMMKMGDKDKMPMKGKKSGKGCK